MTWNWQTAIDLWTSGLAGGAFFAAFLVDRVTGGRHKSLMRTALYVGIPLAAIGVLFLVLDLGKPLWFWHLFARWEPISPMFWGTWTLSVWLVVSIALVVLWWAEGFRPAGKLSELAEALLSALRDLAPFTNILSWVLVVVSAVLMAYTGVLLSASNRPLWSASPMLPAVFVVSALLTGVAALILALTAGLGRAGAVELVARLGQASIILIGLEIAALAIYLIWLSSSAVLAVYEGVSILVSGALWPPFWVGVGVVGLLLPLAMELYVLYKRDGHEVPLMALSSVCVLVGGIILRMVMVFGGQM